MGQMVHGAVTQEKTIVEVDGSATVIEDPDDSGKKGVDGGGRLYLGSDYEGREVEYAVRVVGDDE